MWNDLWILAKDHYKLIAAALALWIIIGQYRKTQRWKNAKFIVSKFEAIQQNRYTEIIHELLDWNESTLLIPYKGEDVPVHFTDEKLVWMLRPHKIDPELTEEEAALRYAFDQFLGELEQIAYLNQTALLKTEEIKPQFGYWLTIIGRKKNGRKSERTVQAIHNYLHHYKKEGTLRLLRGMGFYNIRYNEKIINYTKPA